VIRGHPTITSFVESNSMSLDTLYSVLATLPALESITLSNHEPHARLDDECILANPESLTELLRKPSLRSVSFYAFHFTRALCQATANALMEGTVVTNLSFEKCSFSAEECDAIMAKALASNTSVASIVVLFPRSETLYNALAMALPSNSTLRDLSFLYGTDISAEHLSPVLLALGNNEGLKTLKVDVHGPTEESLCTALNDGLKMNETLESLNLNYHAPLDDENCALWITAFSFLRTNKALKSLMLTVNVDTTESCLSAFRIDIVAMLHDNASLESLSIDHENFNRNQSRGVFRTRHHASTQSIAQDS
jgi:hypothetical protein